MMLESYWPTPKAVNACIKNEAETADVSVLLAVHQPSPLVQRSASTGNITSATEEDLLNAFLTDNVPGGALLMPITGPSGVGKSHIVRWLDAQLRRSSKRDQLHIIRIPKSASLRTVVELILEPLKDDPRYAKAQDDLTRAVGEVNLNEAVITFRAHLQNGLTARRTRMITEIRENPDGNRDLKALIGHAEKLPQMFADGALEQHFVDNVLSKVVSRALRGRTEDQDVDDELPQFIASDLVLPETVAINQASRPVRDYYLRNIANVETDRLQPVVDLLNDAVDPAIGNVFKLEQNAGGMTLQDIILAVREILLTDDKDLVLLVEDFAALAGIQEVLLKVCIQEGERDGKKVRATMRTAMALTDGYLSFRDTILTRAQREWVIGGRTLTDEEIREGVVEMAGAYLNAARWGDAELRRKYKRDPEQSLTDWLPAWRDENLSDEESEAVSAFEYNSKGHALFPFNRQALYALTNRHLAVGGKLDFNPRRVINEILRNTLLMRSTFEAGSFPPAGYEGFAPNANLANWIRQTNPPEAVRRRLGPLLTAWGGNPLDTAAIAHIPPSIFITFSLPTPTDLANISFVPKAGSSKLTVTTSKNADSTSATTPVEASSSAKPTAEDPQISDLRAKLDAWSNGSLLEQTDARKVRNALYELLKDAIDLPELRLKDRELSASWITIPKARGNPQAGTMLNVCEDASDEFGTVRAGLIAAVRCVSLNSKKWTYPQADEDYVATAPLIEHLAGQLKPKIIEDANAQIATLGRTLITQSRIAGLSPPVKPSSVDGLLVGLFAPTQFKEAAEFDDNWDRLYATALGPIGSTPARDLLHTELFARSGCYQGGSGGQLFGLDIVRLMDHIGDEGVPAAASANFSEELKAYIRLVSEGRIQPQIRAVTAKLQDFKTQVAEYIDADFDKAAFVDDLESIVLLLTKTGTLPTEPNLKKFEGQLLEFKQSAFVDLVKKTTIVLEASDQPEKLLNALGAIDLGMIARTMSFLQQANQLVAAAETNVTREETDRGQSDPVALSQELTAMLSLIAGSANEDRGWRTR